MKIKTIVAASLVSAVGAVGAAGATGSTALAGCGVTLELHNRGSADVTIDWEDSDARTRQQVFGQWVNGFWKKLGDHVTEVEAGDTVQQAFVLDLGCNLQRQYRLEVTEGGSTRIEYFPGGSNWTTDLTPHIHVD